MRRSLVLVSIVALMSLGVLDVEALPSEDASSGSQIGSAFDLWYGLLVSTFGLGLSEESEEPADSPGATSASWIGTELYDPFDDDPGGGGLPDEDECEWVTVCDPSGCTTTITCD